MKECKEIQREASSQGVGPKASAVRCVAGGSKPVATNKPVDEAIEMTSSPAGCDADALRQKGDDYLSGGMDAAALAAFEKSMACRPDPGLVRKAYMAACRSKNATKAKLYFSRIPTSMQGSLGQICIRLGVSVP